MTLKEKNLKLIGTLEHVNKVLKERIVNRAFAMGGSASIPPWVSDLMADVDKTITECYNKD